MKNWNQKVDFVSLVRAEIEYQHLKNSKKLMLKNSMSLTKWLNPFAIGRKSWPMFAKKLRKMQHRCQKTPLSLETKLLEMMRRMKQ